MLDSLYIKNFRLFKLLEIEHLSNVNLITGKNNSGKSCVLEALRVYASNADIKVLKDIIEEREQDWESNFTPYKSSFIKNIDNPFRHLFYNYKFPLLKNEKIEISGNKIELEKLKIFVSAYIPKDDHDRISYQEIELNKNIFSLKTGGNIQVWLKAERFGEDINLLLLAEYQGYYHSRLQSLSLIDHREFNHQYNVQFIPTKDLTSKKVNILWNKINIKPNLRHEVFNALRLIDENIQEVVVLNKHDSDTTTAMLVYNNDLQVPLKSLGDGVTHLFHIILALLNAKDGILLIDEFENGLHYSVQPKVWELIFTLSQKLNVQVFATTHSRDAIRSFHEIWQQQEELGTFHRLDVYEDDIRAMPYDCESLGDTLDMDGEMR